MTIRRLPLSSPTTHRRWPLILPAVCAILVLFAWQGRSLAAGPLVADERPDPARTLTLEERIACQTALENVYWRHRIWPERNPTAKPALEEVMPAAAIRAKVVDGLAESAALAALWQAPITGPMLQAEVERQARTSRDPALLSELWEALGGDPVLVAECLARPALASRLFERYFRHDRRFADQTLDSWWQANRRSFAPDFGVPEASYRLPAQTAGSLLDDTWTDTASIPQVTLGGAVWTGSEMLFFGDGTQGYRYDPATDSWQTLTVVNAPASRTEFTTVWTGSEMIVWGGCSGGTEFCTMNSGGRYNPATDTWTSTSGSGAPNPRRLHGAVWAGTVMIVWGGCTEDPNGNQNCNVGLNSGGRYDPVTNSWQPTSLAGAPSARNLPELVWAGDQMVLWSGTNAVDPGRRYDPVTDTWQSISTTNAPAGSLSSLVWSGSEVIAWGGCTGAPFCSTPTNTGGRYNPSSDSWTPVTLTGAPSPRWLHGATWAPGEMVVWGGTDGPTSFLGDGARYDPASDSWSLIAALNAPVARSQPSVFWTGADVLVWGGLGVGGFANTRGGARYNLGTETWVPISDEDPFSARSLHTATWTGVEMMAWGGYGDNQVGGISTGRLYYPATDTWDFVSQTNAPPGGAGHSALWTGTEVLIFGGQVFSWEAPAEGGRYNPMTDSWTPTNTNGAPEQRGQHSAVWTGSKMIVWGGAVHDSPADSFGAIYDLASDSWSAMNLAGAPEARRLAPAVWTGSEMVVWGGVGIFGLFDTGARYDLASDSWTPTSSLNAPTARVMHQTIWTGEEMIVWGGALELSPWDLTNSGARYDPQSDTWTATNTTGAPAPTARHTAVWTGSEMIVWGGCEDNSSCLRSTSGGGRYDPLTDSWMLTSLQNAPEGRQLHAVVWTGTEMIVWGGEGENGYRNTGGRYAADVAPGFLLAPQQLSRSVCAPRRGIFNILVDQVADFTDPVALSVTGAPAGTVFYPSAVVTPPGNAYLIAQSGVAPGTFELDVTGFAAGASPPARTISVDMTVYTAVAGAPSLLSPAPGQLDVPLVPTFQWSAVAQASRYLVVLLQAGTVVDYAVTDETSHSFATPLDPLTPYTWTVRALNPCGRGAFAPPSSFTTQGTVTLLLVDDDNNFPDVRPYYTAALDALGVSYAIWDTANSDDEPDLATLVQYEMVVWFTGTSFGGFAGPGNPGEAALGAYLDEGGCLFINSQDYYWDRGLTPFMQAYLGALSVQSDVFHDTVTGQGAIYGGLGPYGLTDAIISYSDRVNPSPAAQLAFLGDAGNAAITKDAGGYRTTFWGFAWETLPDAGRSETMSATVDWCTGP